MAKYNAQMSRWSALVCKTADIIGSKMLGSATFLRKDVSIKVGTLCSYEVTGPTGELVPDSRSVKDDLLENIRQIIKKNVVGICNYAKYRLTSARIEAGNVSIGMIRKRARGIRDTDYFKLKIRQTSLPDDSSVFYLAEKTEPRRLGMS